MTMTLAAALASLQPAPALHVTDVRCPRCGAPGGFQCRDAPGEVRPTFRRAAHFERSAAIAKARRCAARNWNATWAPDTSPRVAATPCACEGAYGPCPHETL